MTAKKKPRWMYWALLLIVLATSLGYGWYRNGRESGGVAFQTAAISRGGLTQSVTASGQLNPVVKVEVGSQISGIIQKLLADFNSVVKEGQVVAQIDPAAYEANAIQAEGNLASAQAALELAQVNTRRAEELLKSKLISQSEYDNILAHLHQSEAAARISEGVLQKAKVDLARCTIYSPIDGIVISRDVNVGQTVAASLSAPKLFVIANDLAKMQIEARISEADIGRIEAGQDVHFTVDAFPGERFHGQVIQVRNAAILDQTVVTYETIIEVKNSELKLKPGMTANVTIVIARRDAVLKVPNSAFRFRPPKGVEVRKAESPESAAAGKEKKSGGSSSKKSKRSAGATVHRLLDGALHAVTLKTGITDGRETEVLAGLNEGDAVVVDLVESEAKPTWMTRLLALIKNQ